MSKTKLQLERSCIRLITKLELEADAPRTEDFPPQTCHHLHCPVPAWATIISDTDCSSCFIICVAALTIVLLHSSHKGLFQVFMSQISLFLPSKLCNDSPFFPQRDEVLTVASFLLWLLLVRPCWFTPYPLCVPRLVPLPGTLPSRI